jgi:hypothetical protein
VEVGLGSLTSDHHQTSQHTIARFITSDASSAHLHAANDLLGTNLHLESHPIQPYWVLVLSEKPTRLYQGLNNYPEEITDIDFPSII